MTTAMDEAQHDGPPAGPPPWINDTIQQQIEWRDGDIVVSVPPKSGTTWTMNIVHQLRSGGDPTFVDIYCRGAVAGNRSGARPHARRTRGCVRRDAPRPPAGVQEPCRAAHPAVPTPRRGARRSLRRGRAQSRRSRGLVSALHPSALRRVVRSMARSEGRTRRVPTSKRSSPASAVTRSCR